MSTARSRSPVHMARSLVGPMWRSARAAGADALRIAAQVSGIDRAIPRPPGASGATILMYHSVPAPNVEPFVHPEMRFSPDRFRAQMSFLARRRRVIPMGELADAIQAGRSPLPGTVVITFDDGYLDNLEVAAPILAELQLPAILYVPTSYLDDGRPQWIDRLWTAFASRTRHRLRLPDGRTVQLSSRGACREAMGTLRSRLIPSIPPGREALLDDIDDQLRPDPPAARLTMTWADAHRLVSQFPRWELGLHTRDHVDMTALDAHAAAAELADASRDFERATGARPVHFSFPYGRASDSLRGLLRSMGFRSAVAAGPAYSSIADPLRLSRVSGHLCLPLLAYWTATGRRARGGLRE